MNIYDVRRLATATFLIISLAVVGVFLYLSNLLVDDLSAQERARMQIWAGATKQIADIGNGEPDTSLDFLLSILEENRNIPVILTDDSGTILDHRNFNLPEPIDSLNPLFISEVNAEYLQRQLDHLLTTPNVIHIHLAPGQDQHLYYADSRLLRSLSLYPYIQLAVMLAFVAVVYFAVSSTRRAEQNKVWVGLSKETAHQLGTPISSLMAWLELLEAQGVDPDTIQEMDKDVKRLSTIASRFSKIGSRPQMESGDLRSLVRRSVAYMSTRISPRTSLTITEPADSSSTAVGEHPLEVMQSGPLLEWVMENLIKNAVDAMEGQGSINVSVFPDASGRMAVIEVADTGKGMPRKNFKTVFRPGYTTKKRGWGLGLALAKRIIEEYHSGRIFVKSSEPGAGTTFRIELPIPPKSR